MEEIKEESDKEIKINSENEKEAKISYSKELDKIMNNKKPPEITLSLLNILIRDFLSKKFHVRKDLEYDEMTEFFLSKNKPEIANLCHDMTERLYTGESINTEEINKIIIKFRNLIENEQGKEGKEEKSIMKRIWGKLSSKKIEKQAVKTEPSKTAINIINYELEKYNPSLRADKEKENVISEISLSETKDKKISPELIPSLDKSMQNQQKSYLIEHIDNLERIKQRIQERKRLMLAAMAGSNTQ